jgi:endoglycosylceramidase
MRDGKKLKTLLVAMLLWSVGCASDDADGRGLHASGGKLRDGAGREVRLRGINARVAGLFDVSFHDGRIPLEEIPPFGAEDLRLLATELGLNALRVPINWSGLQPLAPGPLDPDYLSRLDEVLDLCAQERVWCLVDLHQDAWSKEIGEDGAPLWAIQPPPDELLEGPLEDLEARRTSAQVLRAFATFFGGGADLQATYLTLLEDLAEHLAGRPWVAGIEVFNEPVGDDLEILQFARAAVQAVHRGDPDRLALFEPNALRNLRDEAETLGGLGLENSGYAPHLYPEVFSGSRESWRNGEPARLVKSVANARDEAAEHGAPLIVTEYGIDPEAANGLAWIERMEEEMDAAGASRFFWLYEESSQDRWGLYDRDGAWRSELATVLARPFPEAVAGTVLNASLDENELAVELRGGGEHRLRVPPLWAGEELRVSCDGSPASFERAGASVRVHCGDGGDHRLVAAR